MNRLKTTTKKWFKSNCKKVCFSFAISLSLKYFWHLSILFSISMWCNAIKLDSVCGRSCFFSFLLMQKWLIFIINIDIILNVCLHGSKILYSVHSTFANWNYVYNGLILFLFYLIFFSEVFNLIKTKKLTEIWLYGLFY